MHNDHILRCKFHFLLVKNIEILHADIILFIEETFFLYTGHIKDIQLRKCIFQTFYFFEFDVVLTQYIVADITWDTQLFRRNQDKTDSCVADQCTDQGVNGTSEL